MEKLDLGCYAEFIFTAKCVLKGYIVSTPVIQKPIYDCLVHTEKGLYKVQIKATNTKKEFNSYLFKVCHNKGGKKSIKYKTDEIDFLALYVHDLEGFFLIPYDQEQQTFRVSRKNRYSKYFDNFAFDFFP